MKVSFKSVNTEVPKLQKTQCNLFSPCIVRLQLKNVPDGNKNQSSPD